MYLYSEYCKPKVYTVWVYGPPKILLRSTQNPKDSMYLLM